MVVPELKLNAPCGRIRCFNGWDRPREVSMALRDLELWLVWKGRGRMRTRERVYELTPGFCILMRPGGIYDTEQDEHDRLGITFIHFQCAGGEKVWRRWPEFLGMHDVDYLDAVSRRIVELFALSPGIGEQLLRALLADLLHKRPASQPENVSQHREKILRMVRELHAAETLPTVEQMAAQMHLSAAHFSRLFRSVIGKRPMEFLMLHRLSQARHLLRETSLSVSEIADRLGYTDVFFFSRQFKEKCGVSPQEFRKHPE